jgi:transcriptional regulator with XRE-family HTH domain
MSSETMKEIVDRIKSRRIELELSFQDLANLTDMSKSTLQRYEAGGIKNIPLDRLKILAKALKVSPEWIMGWDEEHSSNEPEIRILAAHAIDDLTEEEQLEIIKYAKYIKSQREEIKK